MGYHLKEIKRGTFGGPSKITEEYEEWMDARDQINPIMELVELSDLLGAIEGYTKNKFNLDLGDLIAMKSATERAFKDGTREAREV